MEVSFDSKEESKRKQQEAFLRLTGVERIYNFLGLMQYFNSLPKNDGKLEKTDNFVIIIERY